MIDKCLKSNQINHKNMRRSKNFRQGGGGPGQSDKKISDNVFFVLVLSLFYRSQMVNFKEIYHFQGSRGGPTFSRGGGGGPTFTRGGGGPIAYSL